METEIKNVPILLKDGTPVKVGGTVYIPEIMETTSYQSDLKRYRDRYISTFSGETRVKKRIYKVISVNQNANSRSFTLRSDLGCETTYSVKNQCLPEGMVGTLAAFNKFKKEFDNKDAERIKTKADEILSNACAQYEKAQRKNEKLIKAIKKLTK